MRELKFRAWDKKQKKMLCGVSIGTIKVWDENTPLLSNEFSYSEDCIFEQYTGLKDKNGKEIYEGDIVDKKYDNLAIFDRNGVVGMGYLYDSDGYNNGEIYGWKAGDSSLADVCDACEVIGNIHENPELLGGKK